MIPVEDILFDCTVDYPNTAAFKEAVKREGVWGRQLMEGRIGGGSY